MKRILLSFCIAISLLQTEAQQQGGNHKKGIISGISRFKPAEAPAYTKEKVILQQNEGKWVTGTGKLIGEETDALGLSHYRSQQVINGIPVENAFFIEHVEAKKV